MRILQEIVNDGVDHPDRTGTGRRSITSRMMKIDLGKEFPLITTQKVFVRGAFEELKWMLSGSTSVHDLHQKGIHFWDSWAIQKEDYEKSSLMQTLVSSGRIPSYHDSNQTPYEYDLNSIYYLNKFYGANPHLMDGSIGRLYGANWRGDKSVGYYHHKTSSKSDQLQNLLNSIQEDRYGSRHVMTTLIPDHLSERGLSPQENATLGFGALYPCHGIHLQFQILPQGNHSPDQKGRKKDKLHCLVTARSQDWAVGTIINVPFYAFFMHLIAKQFNLDLGELSYVGCDNHIYKNQTDSIIEQLSRSIDPNLALPNLRIRESVPQSFDKTGQCLVNWEDIEFITPYTPMKHIPRAVSV